VIVEGDTIFALVNKGRTETSDYGPRFNVGDQRRVANEFLWNEKQRQILAYEATSGRLRWQKETRVSPLTLVADSERVYFHDGEKVVCLERERGDELWTSEPATRRPTFTMNFGPRLVVYKDVILFAGGDRTMKGLAADTGKELWTAAHDRSAYQSPEDLLVAGGLVWSAPTTQTRDTGIFTGRDPFTGEVESEFPPNVDTRSRRDSPSRTGSSTAREAACSGSSRRATERRGRSTSFRRCPSGTAWPPRTGGSTSHRRTEACRAWRGGEEDASDAGDPT
jgi:outer membrane protein assembly factor BamB